MKELQILRNACSDTMDIMESFEQEMILGGKVINCAQGFEYNTETKEESCNCGYVVSGEKPIFPAE